MADDHQDEVSTTPCPGCGEPVEEGDICENCGYSELRCPFCDLVVSSMGSESESTTDPCDCVVAWGNYGDETVWEDDAFRTRLFNRWAKEQGLTRAERDEERESFNPSADEIEELCSEDGNVEVLQHDDGAGHGHSIGSWFVFRRRTRKTKRTAAPSK